MNIPLLPEQKLIVEAFVDTIISEMGPIKARHFFKAFYENKLLKGQGEKYIEFKNYADELLKQKIKEIKN